MVQLTMHRFICEMPRLHTHHFVCEMPWLHIYCIICEKQWLHMHHFISEMQWLNMRHLICEMAWLHIQHFICEIWLATHYIFKFDFVRVPPQKCYNAASCIYLKITNFAYTRLTSWSKDFPHLSFLKIYKIYLQICTDILLFIDRYTVKWKVNTCLTF